MMVAPLRLKNISYFIVNRTYYNKTRFYLFI
jgi:hypothetical protein